MKIKKGQPGYIKERKKRYLLLALIEFAVVIAILLVGYFQTGTKMNLLTVVAIVGCLPACKMLVEFIVMAPHKGIEIEKYNEIEEKAPLLMKVYDLLVSGDDKMMQLDVAVIYGQTVCGYSSSPKTDEAKLSKYLKEMLQNNKCEKVTVKIFRDYNAFLSRAEGMNNIASVSQEDTGRKERKIRRLLYSTSM